MTIALLKILAGFLCLYYGAAIGVKGAVRVALFLRVSKILIGVCVLAFGTSLPEACVSFVASGKGNSLLALGNVLGSNCANIGLVLGVTVLIRPLPFDKRAVRNELLFVVVSGFVVFFLMLDSTLSRIDAIGLLLLLIAFGCSLIAGHKRDIQDAAAEKAEGSRWLSLSMVIVGMSVLIYGARIFVAGATDIAHFFGVPDWVIGLTLVAIGTSVPELATSVVSTLKREASLVVGNILGSNALNIYFVLAVSALICPIRVVDENFIEQLGFFLIFSIMPYPLMMRSHMLRRWVGGVLLSIYAVYIGWIAFRFM